LPDGKYDYIANLPSGSGNALQQEIKNQFGIVGRFEPQPKNVLVLKIKDPDILKSKLTSRKSFGEKAGYWNEGNKRDYVLHRCRFIQNLNVYAVGTGVF
jgi:hypothetical protein